MEVGGDPGSLSGHCGTGGGARHPLSCLPSPRFAVSDAGLTEMHFSADSMSALLSQ